MNSNEDQSYLSDAEGKPDLKGDFVTYKALPYPLPDAWKNEFMACESIQAVTAVERRCRAAIGFQNTKVYIPPVRRI